MDNIKTTIQNRFVKYNTLMLYVFFAGIVSSIAIIDYFNLIKLQRDQATLTANNLYAEIRQSYSDIQINLGKLSQNSLVINSLIDVTQSSPYINNTLTDLVTYTDIDDAVIFSASGEVYHSANQKQPDWLAPAYVRAVITSAKPATFFTKGFFQTIVPVKYGNATLGGIAIHFSALNLLPSQLQTLSFNANLTILDWSYKLHDDWEDKTAIYAAQTLEHPLNDFQTTFALKDSHSQSVSFIRSWLTNLILVGAIGLIILRAIAKRVGFKMAQPVIQLTQKIHAKKYPVSPVGTGDELELVAQAYDLVSKDLLKMNAKLENSVRERTFELEQKANSLKIALEEVKHLDKLKNQFISTVSHELRTPLTSIHGSLGLLTSGALDEQPDKRDSLLQLAKSNSERLGKLINDLLDFQKLEAHAIHLEKERIDLVLLVKNAIEASKGYQEIYQVNVATLDTSEEVIFVEVDPHRIRQVFDNLISNAIKFSPKNKPVEVSIIKNDNSVKIAVRDYGNGVPEAFIPKLFKPFSQADSSDTRRHDGTGLGLSISQDLMRAHGGAIKYFPRNTGCVFQMIIPTNFDIESVNFETDNTESKTN